MKFRNIVKYACVALIFTTLSGCATAIPKDALILQEQSMAWRQMQSRRFETNAEAEVLSACAALLQDLGFTISESETKIGLIAAYKERDATEAGQVISSIIFSALFGSDVPIDKVQKMKASIVMRPIGEKKQNIVVRVTFQRIVWNNRNEISKIERLNNPQQYQEFFSKLSKAMFLEAHEI